jgi:hypothetical protein
MANPATTADLESRWRPLVGQEVTNGQTFLDDAWGMLKRRIPTIETLIADDVDLEAEVVRVLATAVLRVMKNPDGKRSESIDDYRWERDEALAAGVLYFTDDELADLLPGSGERGRAFVIDPLAGRDWTDWS